MNNHAIIQNIIEYIENHLEDDLSLDKISHELNYSKFYLSRIFSATANCTIYKYIQIKRLTLAAQKLVETEKPLIDIAYEAHYSSQQAFTLAFRRLYLCTPQTYRRNRIFYPAQTKISLISPPCSCSHSHFISGGKLAA